MWNMIPFLARRWDHYSRWMVILQRWAPTAAEDFPSQIPFWIRLKGIPLHYWKKEVLLSLGSELGTYEGQEITKTSCFMKDWRNIAQNVTDSRQVRSPPTHQQSSHHLELRDNQRGSYHSRDSPYSVRKGVSEATRESSRDSVTRNLCPDRSQRSPFYHRESQKTPDNDVPRWTEMKKWNQGPVERAARVQRVAQGEEEGLMQSTAARMVELHNATQAVQAYHLSQPTRAVSPLGPPPPPPPPPPPTHGHIPVAQRLVFPDEQVERNLNTNLKPQKVIKKRLGRPPKNKGIASPSSLPGTSTRKRKVQLVRSSPNRRTPVRKTTQPKRSNQPPQQNNPGLSTAQNLEETAQPSTSQAPTCQLIPAIERPSSVFRKPSNPHPSR
uniref:Uncharacterized protein n=1 Tax=Noccaea caerulescens TaxID=107243 RepID=A0A1J3F9K3_NOCCA